MLDRRQLPPDFDALTYLELHPDVKNAGADAADHYLRHGLGEGRPYKRSNVAVIAKAISERFVATVPSAQNVIDLFQGQWSSTMPAESGLVSTPGRAGLFDDGRIHWAHEVLGPFTGMQMLELGPLEGGQSSTLQKLGAESVTAIEANAGAFLRCLCIKEVCGLDRVHFLLGDFVQYLQETPKRFDVIIACGVLYHMVDPLRLLRNLASHTDRLFLWTHYYDDAIAQTRHDANLFRRDSGVDALLEGYSGRRKLYAQEAFDWQGFTGGINTHAVWMERESILDFLRDSGFSDIRINFDAPDHPAGPAFAICAKRG